MSEYNIESISNLAKQIRVNVIRMTHRAGSGHPGGALGMADVFALLYSNFLNIHPQNLSDDDRDYFILSNGHICTAWYATLAEFGFFGKDLLKTFRQINSQLQGHPRYFPQLGIDNTSGPLGQGLSQSIGIVLSKMISSHSGQVWTMLSDGEHQEGQIWEAYQFAGFHRLNLKIIIDRNQFQIGGKTEKILGLGPLKRKINSFRWRVLETSAHDYKQLFQTLTDAQNSQLPVAIICHSILGKGVSFMENNFEWHGKAPNKNQAIQAMKDLGVENPEELLW